MNRDIERTGYTVEELAKIAYRIAADAMRKNRDLAESDEDITAWEHYNDLRLAFEALANGER